MSKKKLEVRILTWISLLQFGWCLPQSFRVTPQDTEVVAGSDVILRCEVDNQQGSVQWTQGGFALGFNRSIPGFPRFTVIGEESQGIHNLRITDVQMGDDGEYQCQVTPGSSGGGKAIRHPATLTVLIPPTSIEMEDHEPNARITVKAGDSLTLKCLIKNAKPVSRVAWFRGNDPLRLDSQADEEEPSEDSNLATLRTTITFTPSHSDNGVEYGCQAVHPALESSNTQMVARVRLDVHYEPGAPEITGYTEGEIVRAGDRKTLTCRARGGNPIPEVFWYKNGAQIDKTFIKHRNYAINEHEFEVEASDNLAKYECHVMNVMTTQPKKAEIQLRVNFAASEVTIRGPSEAKVGDIIAVSCVAENSNPPADVNLVINDHTPPGATSRTQKVDNGGWNTITNLTNYEVRPIDSDLTVNCYTHNVALASTEIDTMVISVLRPPDPPTILGYELGRRLRKGDRQRLTCISNGGNPLATLTWYKGTQELTATDTRHEGGAAISELNFVLDESDNEAEYKCEATNSATTVALMNATILSVMFPPSGVKVKARPRHIKANSQATLVCESASSNPLANVTWWRDGFEVEAGDLEYKPGQFGGHTTKHTVKLNVTAEDDGAVYTCQADNRFGTTTHDAVTLNVRYPPVWISVPEEALEVTEGENIKVNVSAKGNPDGITYLWKRYDEGVMTGSLLNITGITKDKTGIYTVEATNAEGTSSKNVSVNVKYAPSITSVSGGRNLTQGETVTLICQADASPSPEMTWQREEYDFSKATVEKHPTQNIVEITIKNVTFEDTGIFVCHASNSIGEEATANATIVVKHKPIIDQSSRFQKAAAEAGGNARLICRASGAPYVSFTWFTKDNTPIEKAIYARFDNRYMVEETKLVDDLVTYESVLQVKNVSSKDYGFFECQARNPLGSSRSAVHLDGTSKPDSPTDVKVVNFTHDSVTLVWTPGFNGGLVQKYRVRYAVSGTDRYQYADAYPENSTSFSVSGLSLGTTYSFSLLAYNDKGESEYSKGEVQAETESSPPLTEVERAISRVLAEKADLPRVVTLSVSTVGGLLVLVNVVLVACVLRRRRRRKGSHASSDKGSSKSTTIEMYAPSSYTGTVTGETLSSISEKSRESYTHEDSADEYEAEAARVTAASTYLIEQLEPPPQYATRPPPHILPPPPSHNDLNIDDGYDDIRRNQYNAALDRAAAGGGYGTLGRRNPSTDHYNITNTEGHYSLQNTRYNTYQPANHAPPLTAHTHTHNQNTDSLRRNPPSKLHFPKDYIRNGSMNITVPGNATPSSMGGMVGGQYGNKPQSPTRTHPPHTPMLSTFASDPSQPSPGGVPLEHRGHLV